jgi:RING finger protein 113A
MCCLLEVKPPVADDDESDYEIKEGEEDGLDADGLPFACFICRGDFVNPVVTLCGHYFCSTCAIGASNDSKCQACGKETSGVFNTARKLIKKLKEKERASS